MGRRGELFPFAASPIPLVPVSLSPLCLCASVPLWFPFSVYSANREALSYHIGNALKKQRSDSYFRCCYRISGKELRL